MSTSPDPTVTESGGKRIHRTADPAALTRPVATAARPYVAASTPTGAARPYVAASTPTGTVSTQVAESTPTVAVSTTNSEHVPGIRYIWWRTLLTTLAIAIITLFFFRGDWVRGSALLALFALVICEQVIVQVRQDQTPPSRQAMRVLLLSTAVAMVVGTSFGLAGGFTWRMWTGVRHTTQLPSPTPNAGHALGNRPGRVAGSLGLAFSPDSTAVAEGSAQGINVIDLKTEFVKQSFFLPNLGSNSLQLLGIAWMTNGAYIAATYRTTGADNGQQFGATIWDTVSGNVVDTLPLPTVPLSLSWAPNNQLLALVIGPTKTSTLGLVEVWSVAAKQVVGTMYTAGITTPNDGNQVLSWSPDTAYLALLENEQSFILVNPQTGQISLRYEDTQPIHVLTWSPNGLYVATGHEDGTTSIFDMHQQSLLGVISAQSGPIKQLSWSPTSQRLLIAGSSRLTIVAVPTLQKLHVLDRSAMNKPGAPIQPGATAIPSPSASPSAELTPTPPINSAANQVLTADWSPDGKYICARFGDDALVVWSTAGF